MFFIKKFANSLKKEWIEPTNEKVYNENPIKRIIDGKLYDTSKAKKICTLHVSSKHIPNYRLPFIDSAVKVLVYKGNTEWFIEYHGFIEPIVESWVKNILSEDDTDKYIELFGEVEEA